MRIPSIRRELVLAPLLLLGAVALSAQQLPTGGCRGAASCAGPRGFKSLLDFAGEGNPPLFSIGASYQGGLSLRIVRPVRPVPSDSRAIDAAVALFLKRHPLRVPARPEEAPAQSQNPDRPRP